MRAREVLKLQTGDIITCRECEALGCDGKPAKINMDILPCGCKYYRHSRNIHVFYVIFCEDFDRPQKSGWVKINGVPITGRSIKLVKKAERK